MDGAHFLDIVNAVHLGPMHICIAGIFRMMGATGTLLKLVRGIFIYGMPTCNAVGWDVSHPGKGPSMGLLY